MATNNNRTITWSQVLKTLGAVGVIIAAIITGVVSIITTNMQINANSNLRVLTSHLQVHLHQKNLQMIVPPIQRKQMIPIQAKH